MANPINQINKISSQVNIPVRKIFTTIPQCQSVQELQDATTKAMNGLSDQLVRQLQNTSVEIKQSIPTSISLGQQIQNSINTAVANIPVTPITSTNTLNGLSPIQILGNQITLAANSVTNSYIASNSIQAQNMAVNAITASNAALAANSVVDSKIVSVGINKVTYGTSIFAGDVVLSRGISLPVIVLSNSAITLFGQADASTGGTGLTSKPYTSIASNGILLASGSNPSVLINSTSITNYSVNANNAYAFSQLNSGQLIFQSDTQVGGFYNGYYFKTSIGSSNILMTLTNGSTTVASLDLSSSGITISDSSFSTSVTSSGITISTGGSAGNPSVNLTSSGLTISNNSSGSNLSNIVIGSSSIVISGGSGGSANTLTANASSLTIQSGSSSLLSLTSSGINLQTSTCLMQLASAGGYPNSAVFTYSGTSTVITGNIIQTGDCQAAQISVISPPVSPFRITGGTIYTSATNGSYATPANVDGYILITVNSTVYKIPLYRN